MLVLEMSATFWKQHGNGAVEVSFESRTAQNEMSALFHIFTCAFCLVQLVLLFCRRRRRRRRLRMFCFKVPNAWNRRTDQKGLWCEPSEYFINTSCIYTSVSTVHGRSPPTYKELTNPKHDRVNSLPRVANVLWFHHGASLHRQRLLHSNCIH